MVVFHVFTFILLLHSTGGYDYAKFGLNTGVSGLLCFNYIRTQTYTNHAKNESFGVDLDQGKVKGGMLVDADPQGDLCCPLIDCKKVITILYRTSQNFHLKKE